MREAINALDLDATFYPVTDRSGAEDSFRVKAKELADRYGLEGRQRFPLLHDPGADKAMYESDGEQQARARARAPSALPIPAAGAHQHARARC